MPGRRLMLFRPTGARLRTPARRPRPVPAAQNRPPLLPRLGHPTPSVRLFLSSQSFPRAGYPTAEQPAPTISASFLTSTSTRETRPCCLARTGAHLPPPSGRSRQPSRNRVLSTVTLTMRRSRDKRTSTAEVMASSFLRHTFLQPPRIPLPCGREALRDGTRTPATP